MCGKSSCILAVFGQVDAEVPRRVFRCCSTEAGINWNIMIAKQFNAITFLWCGRWGSGGGMWRGDVEGGGVRVPSLDSLAS